MTLPDRFNPYGYNRESIYRTFSLNRSSDNTRFNPSQPIIGVSWYEAAAYCAWLTMNGYKQGWLDPDTVIRLPTWCEWQRAARHTDQRRYPWGCTDPGSEYANYKATGIGKISPVGCFPEGQAVCGAQDLAGNIWEWTATSWKQPQQTDALMDVDQREPIIVAGGSFLDGGEYLCCAARYWYNPYYRYYIQGFRVVWSPRSLV